MVTLCSISCALFASFYIHKGFFWLLITNGSVMVNDVMAYVFGKTMGRTKLIKLSPNKTVEGFIGGGISTVIFAYYVRLFFIFLTKFCLGVSSYF